MSKSIWLEINWIFFLGERSGGIIEILVRHWGHETHEDEDISAEEWDVELATTESFFISIKEKLSEASEGCALSDEVSNELSRWFDESERRM